MVSMRLSVNNKGLLMSNTKPAESADCNKKWFQRGFTDKQHYQGWLSFNDLIDESHTFDDTYRDPYTGRTVHLMEETDLSSLDEDDEAAKFLSDTDE